MTDYGDGRDYVRELESEASTSQARLAEARALLVRARQPFESGYHFDRWDEDVESHFAANPEAPRAIGGFGGGSGVGASERAALESTRAAAERAVLDAMSHAPQDWVQWWADTGGGSGPAGWMKAVGESILALRAVKP